MFPPAIIGGTTSASAGETIEEREMERIRSEQRRLFTDNQGRDYGNSDAQLVSSSSSSPPLTAVPLRRVHSEYTFRFAEEVNLIADVGSPATSGSLERGPGGKDEDDDLFASYMDLEKIESADIADHSFPRGNDEDQNDEDKNNLNLLRRCRSAGDMCGSLIDNGNSNNKKAQDGACEVKKAMSPDKLAELWILDPKRAKRILANRQSAARSKERKARYMVELEKRVQSLRTEATALSVQISLFERDTSGLTNENTELRRQLESMEQHAQLRDALIDALKQEIERLKVATGEPTTATDTFIMHVQNIPQPQQQPQTQQLLVDSSQPKLPRLYPYEPSMSNPNHVDLHTPKLSHVPSFELNIPCSQALDSVRTKKSHINPPEHILPSLQQAVVDSSNMKSQQMHTFDPNLLHLPEPAKVPSIYPLEKGLYLPSLDSSQPRMPQFCTTETNMHASLQPSESTHCSLPQEPFETNFLNGSSQWAGPGRSGAVLDRSGLVPVGYWAV
ncbi:hypothetical protein Cgig2_032842 [Carnegiea gigantea]|uniref:BZIP domain-containing protein n=1 Tax=Carnegiea gigantea TaxID=171969 RepID=A0A9Q1GVI5_9CARY|nr:hypothetical protein Cgig2_032842 [Carnegiea gigantea]